MLPLSEREQRVWELTCDINQRGVQVDVPAVRRARELVREESESLRSEFQNLVGCSPQASVKVAQWCGLPNVNSQTVEAALKRPLEANKRRAYNCVSCSVAPHWQSWTVSSYVPVLMNAYAGHSFMRGLSELAGGQVEESSCRIFQEEWENSLRWLLIAWWRVGRPKAGSSSCPTSFESFSEDLLWLEILAKLKPVSSPGSRKSPSSSETSPLELTRIKGWPASYTTHPKKK